MKILAIALILNPVIAFGSCDTRDIPELIKCLNEENAYNQRQAARRQAANDNFNQVMYNSNANQIRAQEEYNQIQQRQQHEELMKILNK